MGQIANRQSLAFSERGQLSQAILQFHVEQVLHQWTPIARFESQRNERRAYEDQILCFGGRYELQRTLAIRIAAITLASDSAITIARFGPSKFTRIATKSHDLRYHNRFSELFARIGMKSQGFETTAVSICNNFL